VSLGALVLFNAMACENAVHPTCVCACGGRLHGKRHSAAWIEKTTLELEARLAGHEPMFDADELGLDPEETYDA